MGRETKEAVEDAVGDTTGEILDDFDEYEQFYEDLFEQQRETCREYEDFLDDLRELQREGMGEGLDIPLPDSSMAPGMKDAVGDAVAEGGGDTIKSGSKAIDNTIPNVESATINPKKLTEYALNPNHPVGGNKAKVFESALGYNQSNADDLMRQSLKQISRKQPRNKGHSK